MQTSQRRVKVKINNWDIQPYKAIKSLYIKTFRITSHYSPHVLEIFI